VAGLKPTFLDAIRGREELERTLAHWPAGWKNETCEAPLRVSRASTARDENDEAASQSHAEGSAGQRRPPSRPSAGSRDRVERSEESVSRRDEQEPTNVDQRREHWDSLCAESFTTAELVEILGRSRTRIGQLRQDGELFGFQLAPAQSFYYPRWQISSEGKIEPIVAELADLAWELEYDAIDLHLAMTTPRGTGHGKVTPVQLIAEPGRVTELVRSWGEIGS
jgi:hypothetical protein